MPGPLFTSVPLIERPQTAATGLRTDALVGFTPAGAFAFWGARAAGRLASAASTRGLFLPFHEALRASEAGWQPASTGQRPVLPRA